MIIVLDFFFFSSAQKRMFNLLSANTNTKRVVNLARDTHAEIEPYQCRRDQANLRYDQFLGNETT